MLSFIRGDADVLVSTTIIESGLDIPQANTLIVERADMLGLAQLYQIRGRVGRSDVVAHAYLFYPDSLELSPEARTRLATLADHTELGAGFAIATGPRDPGAGNLLGGEQSGHVAPSGSSCMWSCSARRFRELSGTSVAAARPVRVDAQVDAYIPATTSARRQRRSICTGGSRWPSSRTSFVSCVPRRRIALGLCPSRSSTCSLSRRRS